MKIPLTLDQFKENHWGQLQIIVSALIIDENNNYLMQLRDNRRDLPLRDHWALFGGNLENGETTEACLLREIYEELELSLKTYQWFHEAIYTLPKHHYPLVRKIYFSCPVTDHEASKLVLKEGADMRFFPVSDLLALKRVSPWDLGVVLLHAREHEIFEEHS